MKVENVDAKEIKQWFISLFIYFYSMEKTVYVIIELNFEKIFIYFRLINETFFKCIIHHLLI